MKNLIEFLLEDGTTILVEVDELAEDGVVKASRGGVIVARAQQTFEDAMERVKPVASVIINKLRGLTDSPDEIEVQFGLKMSAEVGAIVAATGIEANYTVTLKWKKVEKVSAKRK